jgi:hypothetical protein
MLEIGAMAVRFQRTELVNADPDRPMLFEVNLSASTARLPLWSEPVCARRRSETRSH